MGDYDRLRQVFYKLLSNAINFTRPRGELVLGASREKTTIIISLADTGIGISGKEREKIFEPFYSTPHNLDFQAISEMFGLDYHRPESINSFEEVFLLSTQKNKSAVFEIVTKRDQNPKNLDAFKKKLMKCEFRPK